MFNLLPANRRNNSLRFSVTVLIGLLFALGLPALATTCNASATSLATYGSGGCSIGNLLFSNFSIGTTTDTIVGPSITVVPGPNTVALPDGTTITATTTGFGLDFTTGSALPPCTTGSFCVAGVSQSLTSTITYEISTLDSSNTINLFTLAGTLHSHANNTTAAIMLEICPNDPSFAQGCGGYQVGNLGQVNGGNITFSGSTSLSFLSTNHLWLRETVYLTTAHGAGSDAEALDFSSVVATPEPPTYGLVGAALIGLGLFRFRPRKGVRPPLTGS